MTESFRPYTGRVPLLVAAAAILALACGGGRARTPAAVPDVVMITPPPESLRAAPDLFLPRASEGRSWDGLDTGTVRIPILVATTRRGVDAERPGFRFGTQDANELSWGLSQVSVPSYRVRAEGEIPRAGSESEPDPARVMFMNSLLPADSVRFIQRVRDDLARTRSRDILVFVHGYNSSFEDAAVRAAQLAADMGFDGTVVLFSWPSAGALTGYVRDQQTARNAGWHLLRLLRDQLPRANPDRIHVIAHSMGSEVLSKALSLVDPRDSLPRLGQVVFAAPDVDARIFSREILPVLRQRSLGVTLYASSEDEALRASRVLNGVLRLGLGGDSLTVLSGMTTVDATRVRGDALGHTLFGNPALLTDLHAVLTEGRAPAERRLLQIRRADGSVFWRFR
ncbi:MAG: alpha/beta hydrolase [Gemmatimonadetes bacterium]|nr:alpha/beta hydrolase [Gemmatimonadota bacterium]